MSLIKIAWRSIQQRSLASVLTMLSMALGVMMVVAVLLILGIVGQSFKDEHGYNMIVGAKGGGLQLTLNTVYYLDKPIENIPYDYYLEFLTAEELKQLHGEEELDELVETRRANRTKREARRLAKLSPEDQREKLLEGRYAYNLAERTPVLAIPVCLGDYYKEFRLVGTTPKLFDELEHDIGEGRKYEFEEGGRNFKHWDEENGFYEAVVGAKVAETHNLKLGSKITASHGAVEGGEGGYLHEEAPFTVVGILKPTGKPNDRAVFINMEGFYLMSGHAKEEKEDDALATEDDFKEPMGGASPSESGDDNDDEAQAPRSSGPRRKGLPIKEREITAILLLTDDFYAKSHENIINEGGVAQVAFPVAVISELFESFVKPIEWLLLALTSMICIVSGVSILVSIYNSMSERKHDIAVMRALGASRKAVMTVILFEAIILALCGGLVGWASGHLAIASISGVIEAQTGVSIGLFDMAPGIRIFDYLGAPRLKIGGISPVVSTEVLLVPLLMILAVIVGFLPALAAYRTDVAKALQ